jgi:type IV pilus assembly protein PilO
MKIDLQTVPKPARIAIAVVPAVIYTVLIVLMLILPKQKEAKALKAEIASQANDITKAQGMAARLDILKEENERLISRLSELSKQLPDEKEISPLLRQVSDKSAEAGLEILAWRPAARVLHPSGIVYQVPVSVTVRGSYHRLANFFSALTKLDRIVNIADISMSSPVLQGDEAVLNITFSAQTFTAYEPGSLAK